MSHDFWDERWAADATGWHRDGVSPELMEHFDALTGGSVRRALVPLCGKSLDLAWLAERAEAVVGVEFVEKAAQTVFEQQGLTPTIQQTPIGPIYTAGNLSVLCADMLTVTPEWVGQFDFVLDRAAFIALAPEVRKTYAQTLATLCHTQAQSLLITLDYDQDLAHGPPFSVPEAEVLKNFEPEFLAHRLSARAVSDVPARFAGTQVSAHVWQLTRST